MERRSEILLLENWNNDFAYIFRFTIEFQDVGNFQGKL